MSKKCLVCGEKNPDEAIYCVTCGTYLSEMSTFTKSNSKTKDTKPSNQPSVVVADIIMPFSSMVVLMVKWAIASIPAMIILFLIGFVILGVLGVSV